jgi:TRAP-type transport system periplasmic protein
MTVYRVFGALCAFLIVAAGPAAAQQVTLKLHHFLGATTSTQKNFLEPWVQKVQAASGGRIKIEIYPSMQLGGTPPQLIDQVRDGVVDLVWTLPSYTAGRFPRTETFELPFVTSDAVTVNKALTEFYRRNLVEEYAPYRVLMLHAHKGQVLHMRAGKAIRTVEDFRGKTIRTPGATGTLLLEALGAVAYQSALPEVSQLLARGVVDGIMAPFEVTPSYKVEELTQSHSFNEPRISTAVFLLAMNRASYDRLPPELKRAIDDTTMENLAEFAGRVWEDAEKPGEDVARARGNEFIRFSDAETEKLRRASEVAIARWAEQLRARQIDGRALIDDAKALIAKHRPKP